MHILKSRLLHWLAAVLLIGAAPLQAAPEIQHWQTGNGARVYFVPAPELPMVDVRIIFDAAGARDRIPGTALLTNALLDQGAGGLDADAIAEAFAAVGARFGTSSHRDMAVINLRSLTRPELLQPALETAASIIQQPGFPARALERERKRLLIALQGKKQSPGAIAEDAFFSALYGDHPYAMDPAGTEDSVKSIKRKDLQQHHRRYYVGNNAVIAVVGALQRNEAERLAETLLGGLPAGEAAPPIAKATPLSEAALIKKAFPSSQTHLLLGQPALRRGDPDYFPLYVGNHILGGSGLVSRLSDEIREKRGLSYSSYSYFSPMRQAGPFRMGLQTRNDQADEALRIMRQTLAEFIEQGPGEAELEAAKKNIAGGFALSLDSNSKIVDNIAMIGFYDLPLDYLDRYVERIEAVSGEQIREAFARHINPDRMVTVMVGGESGTP